MLVAVLLGSLALASCVDDKESDSVTAIRNAKVERLKAAAAADYAQAAYKQAEAAIQQAKAEYDKQELAERLEKIKAEYAADIEAANAEAAANKQTAFNNASGLLTDAYDAYEGAVTDLQGLNMELIEKKIDLAEAESDTAKAIIAFQETMEEQNEIIAQNQAQIELLKSLDTEDKEALLTQIDELNAEINQLETVDAEVTKVATAKAKAALDEACKPLKQSNDAGLWEPVAPEEPEVEYPGDEPEREEGQTDEEYQAVLEDYRARLDAYFAAWDQWSADMRVYRVELQQYQEQLAAYQEVMLPYVAAVDYLYREEVGAYWGFSRETVEIDECAWTVDVPIVEKRISGFNAAIVAAEQQYTAAIKEAEELLGSSKEGEESGVYLALKNAKDELKQAEADLKAAQEAETPDEDAIAGLQLNVAGKKDHIAYLEYLEKYRKEGVEDAKADLAAFKDALAVVAEGSDAEKEYVAALEAAKKLAEAYLKAQHAQHEVTAQLDLLNAEVWTLERLADGLTDVAAEIRECEKAIVDAQAILAKGATIDIENAGGDELEVNVDEIIALLEADIEALETKIALQEGIVAEYKAALEALINSEE